MSSKAHITYTPKNLHKKPPIRPSTETPQQELSKFIQAYKNNISSNTYNASESYLDVIFILRKLSDTYLIRLDSDIYNELYIIAGGGFFKFISILLSDAKIKIEDDGKLLIHVFNFPSNRYHSDVAESQKELIFLLLKHNSTHYSDNFLAMLYISNNKLYLNLFISQLNAPINNKVFTMLSSNGTHVDKIKIDQLINSPGLSMDTVYDIIIGSMLYIRNTLSDAPATRIDPGSTIKTIQENIFSIIDFIFDTYPIQTISIDTVTKCFHPHDIIVPDYIIPSPERTRYHEKISELINIINPVSENYDSKIFNLYSILVNLGFTDIAYLVIKSASVLTINKYFIRSIHYNAKSLISHQLLKTYPNIYCTSSDIYSKINNNIDKLTIDKNMHSNKTSVNSNQVKNYEALSVASGISQPTAIIDKMLEYIDKPIAIVPLNVLNNLIKVRWYDIIASLCKHNNYHMYVICPDILKIPHIELVTDTIIKQPDKYTNRIMFTYNKKEITIDFVDTTLYMMIPNLFKINGLPTDISNYVNYIASYI